MAEPLSISVGVRIGASVVVAGTRLPLAAGAARLASVAAGAER